MQRLVNAYANLSERDRKALKLVALFSPVLVYLVLVQPLFGFYQSARNEFQEARDLLAWMEQNRHNVAAQANAVATEQASGTDVIQRLSFTAEAGGITLDRLQPQGSHGVQVWFQEVEFRKLMDWLQRLKDEGITLESVSVDRTVKEGFVSAQCIFTTRS